MDNLFKKSVDNLKIKTYNIIVVVSGIGRPPARPIVENGDGAKS